MKNPKFVLAPDKFKGSLTGLEFCDVVEKAIKSKLPNAEILKLPLADGGDGTIEVLQHQLHGELVKVQVSDPLFKTIDAQYLFIKEKKLAFIEMAKASGIELLKPEQRNCYYTTSLGTGELILNAIEKEAETIILGIGGSATNDCGIGMATALGYQFKDENGEIVIPIGKNLSKIKTIETTKIHQKLASTTFKIACDVTNPLYGKNGAAFVYGPQKGASHKEIIELDKGLKHVSKLIINQLQKSVHDIKGTGAAGGMGAGCLAFLNGTLLSGIDLFKEIIDFDHQIKSANWIITGEGHLDHQTLSGKTIKGVLESSKREKIPVAALCGKISISNKEATKLGINYTDSIMNYSKNFDDAMTNSANYLSQMAIEFIDKKVK